MRTVLKLFTANIWFFAIYEKDINAIKVFIEHKFDINTLDDYGNTALITILNKNNDTDNKIAKLLIYNGANLDVKNNDCNTALIMASRNCNTEIVRLLLEGELDDINNKGDGRTALEWALDKKNNYEIVKLLLDSGANSRNEIRYHKEYENYIREYKLNILRLIKN